MFLWFETFCSIVYVEAAHVPGCDRERRCPVIHTEASRGVLVGFHQVNKLESSGKRESQLRNCRY